MGCCGNEKDQAKVDRQDRSAMQGRLKIWPKKLCYEFLSMIKWAFWKVCFQGMWRTHTRHPHRILNRLWASNRASFMCCFLPPSPSLSLLSLSTCTAVLSPPAQGQPESIQALCLQVSSRCFNEIMITFSTSKMPFSRQIRLHFRAVYPNYCTCFSSLSISLS